MKNPAHGYKVKKHHPEGVNQFGSLSRRLQKTNTDFISTNPYAKSAFIRHDHRQRALVLVICVSYLSTLCPVSVTCFSLRTNSFQRRALCSRTASACGVYHSGGYEKAEHVCRCPCSWRSGVQQQEDIRRERVALETKLWIN